jgi:hypothetical protein
MKRVTILIPDSIVSVISSSSGIAGVERLEVTPGLMVRALTTNDYHEHVYFEGGVQVVSIEHVPEEEGRVSR